MPEMSTGSTFATACGTVHEWMDWKLAREVKFRFKVWRGLRAALLQ